MLDPRYKGKSEAELLMMGYGALSLFMIINPERFGKPPIPAEEMIYAADRASRGLRNIFPSALKPWATRRLVSFPEVLRTYRRGHMTRRCDGE